MLLGILGEGVPPGSPNPDPISDQKMSFSTPVFRPGFGCSNAVQWINYVLTFNTIQRITNEGTDVRTLGACLQQRSSKVT